ncbi:hypothetical protein QJS10_CPA05g02173 [Acorus calamus]|uniref:Cathepsin propeptide inhibitor domain-containing protein n=1 Tax=Acorus calamus TaxID=4465 RepID=A0AAV9EPD7_ACOCL|nr:hypothetical protein QJS10_CPA05g02173 [Acorus calamus]
MEPDVSIESGCMIRVAVLPVGEVPSAELREYAAMLSRHRRVELSSVSSFYAEHQKSPFGSQPWDTGSLRFKFVVGGSPPSPWEDFQSDRKILAVVGLCHCPSSPDLAVASELFASACRPYASSALVARCFAFSPSDAQVDRMDQVDAVLEEEVKYRYYTVIQLYRRAFIQDNAQRVSTVSFEVEAALKLARFLCRRELAKEVVELLMGAADGAKSLIDASDRLILYVEIARLFGKLGYQRKAAFFSRQVAQLYLQQESVCAAISAMQVLSMTSKAYRVQAARLLRSYYPLITPAGQSGLASTLTNSAERLPSGTRCADPALPFIRIFCGTGQTGGGSLPNLTIRLHSFPVHPSQIDIVKRNPAKEEWWTGSAPSGPFIYTPFSKGETNDNSKQELTWIVGEPVQVLVELANPCGFDLNVESIYLSVHSENFDAFPLSVCLPPNTSKVISLSGVPTKVGPVAIPGCIVHCFGVITEHYFKDVDNLLLGAAQGLVLSDPFRCCGSGKLRNVSVPNISVVPSLPLLVAHVMGGDGSAILYEGEIRDVWISLSNAGCVPVEQAHVSLSGKNQDSVISIAHEALQSALPLKPGAEVTLPVTVKAWQINLLDSDNAATRNASGSMGRLYKEVSSSPLLVIHYAGPLTDSGELQMNDHSVPPGRRLVVPLHVTILQGLSFVKARLLSMEFPAHVSEAHPRSIHIKERLIEDVDGKSKTDSLVKIDPYRGSWGLRLLEMELSNPTDVAFEISVCVQLDNQKNDLSLTSVTDDASDGGYPKTRVERDYSARVLIPLEHFKLPILDGSFFGKDGKADDASGNKVRTNVEKNTKAELNASIKDLVSRIKVRWQSGRNSSGELNIKDAIQAALQTSVMDIVLPDPLTFGFRLVRNVIGEESSDLLKTSDGSILSHEMTPLELLVRNNTKEMMSIRLSVTCRDVAGGNCIEGNKSTVLWAVINNATEVLKARAKVSSPEGSVFCRGPPFHMFISGVLAAVLQAQSKPLQHQPSMEDMHEQWMAQHGRFYADDLENESRLNIFKENVHFIESFNHAGEKPYKLGINAFADMNNDEFKASRNGF